MYKIFNHYLLIEFSSVQSLSHVQLFATPWTAALPAFLSITNSQSFLKLMSTKSVNPSNHIILCHPLLLLPSTFPSIRVFSIESVHSLTCEQLQKRDYLIPSKTWPFPDIFCKTEDRFYFTFPLPFDFSYSLPLSLVLYMKLASRPRKDGYF